MSSPPSSSPGSRPQSPIRRKATPPVKVTWSPPPQYSAAGRWLFEEGHVDIDFYKATIKHAGVQTGTFYLFPHIEVFLEARNDDSGRYTPLHMTLYRWICGDRSRQAGPGSLQQWQGQGEFEQELDRLVRREALLDMNGHPVQRLQGTPVWLAFLTKQYSDGKCSLVSYTAYQPRTSRNAVEKETELPHRTELRPVDCIPGWTSLTVLLCDIAPLGEETEKPWQCWVNAGMDAHVVAALGQLFQPAGNEHRQLLSKQWTALLKARPTTGSALDLPSAFPILVASSIDVPLRSLYVWSVKEHLHSHDHQWRAGAVLPFSVHAWDYALRGTAEEQSDTRPLTGEHQKEASLSKL